MTERIDILGLTGKAGAGKDFVYRRLKAALAQKAYVERVAFANQLRYELESILTQGTFPKASLPALWEKPYPEPIRWLLQHYGTEYRRAQDPDYWVNKAIDMARTGLFQGVDLVVITDVRFENEAAAIRYEGGAVAEVRARGDIRAERLGGISAEGHASEVIDFEADYDIVNNDRPTLPRELAVRLGLERVVL